MDGAGQELFSRTGFALKQDNGSRDRSAFRRNDDFLHR
jgi:hypothetical protein